jgi:hypothetical protein
MQKIKTIAQLYENTSYFYRLAKFAKAVPCKSGGIPCQYLKSCCGGVLQFILEGMTPLICRRLLRC